MLIHKRKKFSLYGITLFFVATTIVQLLSMSPAFAIKADPPSEGGGSIYTRASLVDQLKIIKYYYAIENCFAQHLVYPVNDGRIAGAKWFKTGGDTQENIGVIADTDDHNGYQSCDDIVKNTMKGLFGYSSYSAAGKALKLDSSSPEKNPAASDLLGKHLFNDANPSLDILYGKDGMRYYDLFYTAKAHPCEAHVAKSQTDQDVINNPSTYKIYVADGTSGKVKTQYWTFPEAYKHDVSYGWSTDTPTAGKLDCGDDSHKAGGVGNSDTIAGKLGQKGPAQAYATYLKSHPDATPPDVGGGDGDGGSTPATCNIDSIGWIICPVLSFMSDIVDNAYNVVDGLLTVNSFTGDSGTNDALKNAWSGMRNIANVAFVIAFLFIIYSQITGFGVSNYGIKKMLPRIIVAAILVNASYWLCAIAVDISNVLGSSMKGMFSGLGGDFAPDTSSLGWLNTGQGGGLWGSITSYVVAGSVAVGPILFIGLSALVPALVAAIIAIVTVLLVLVIRQALIILLIVIAPLAFVAFLLPNTQQWFKKWRELFQVLLLMYPIIGAIFGASQLASQIVMNSAGTTGSQDTEATATVMAIQIMGAAIAIIPLFITPVVMKTAGGVLNNIAGKINDPNKGPFDRMRKGAQGFRDSKKSAMNARRMNYGEGKTGVSRAWRRTAGLSKRTGVRMRASGERAKAAEAAAEAGLLMENKDAIETGKLNMAKSAADSARQAKSLKGYDADAQMAALGQSGSTNQSLIFALNTQQKQAEQQAIKEEEQFRAKDNVSQLENALTEAISKGNTISAQAIENQLENKGNAGTAALERVISHADATQGIGEEGKKNWDVMRTELSRNMGGGTMSRSELLKNWGVSTEIGDGDKLASRNKVDDQGNNVLDANGNQVLNGKNKTFSEARTALMTSDMKVEKLASQNSNLQSELINKGKLSVATMQSALSPTNRGHFEAKDIATMEAKVAAAAAAGSAQGGGGSGGQMPGQDTLPGL